MTDKAATAFNTPGATYKAAVVERVAHFTIDPTGALTGTARFILSGPDALDWRQRALRNDAEEVKKEFDDSLKDVFPEGVEAQFDHFLSLDDATVNLIAVIKVSGSIGTAAGKHFIFPALFFQARGGHPFAAQEARTTPVDVHYAKTEEDDVTYSLPAGFTLESAPQSTSASWPEHAVLQIKSTPAAGSVNITRTLVYNFTLLDPKEYSGLHDFYQKVATADQQQLVLARAPAEKGN
jgi:hypothetical protein